MAKSLKISTSSIKIIVKEENYIITNIKIIILLLQAFYINI